MNTIPPPGDRRTAVRFEILGELWGTVQVVRNFRVINLGAGGALVESPVPLCNGSIHEAHVTIEGQRCAIPVRVTRVTADPSAAGACIVALEFVDLPSEARDEIERLVAERCAGQSLGGV
jgi:hypothetical protein